MFHPSLLPFLHVIILLLCPSSRGQGSQCDRCDRRLSCNCSRAGFSAVPVVTERALTLDLSFNNITTVTDSDLRGHARLLVLRLNANRLALIHPAAFQSLWSLEELDLSDNQLSTLNPAWFDKLGALRSLNIMSNTYRSLGPPPVLRGLVSMRRLALGGPSLEELKSGDLAGVTELEELTLNGNNLRRYEQGTLAPLWPLGRAVLHLRGPFLEDPWLAGALLGDLARPDTSLELWDLHLADNRSVQPFTQARAGRLRFLSLRNLSVSDEAIVHFLEVTDGLPLTSLSIDDTTLTGEGRWEKAGWTDHKNIDEFLVRNVRVLNVYKFVSLLALHFLLHYPRRVSVIGSKVFVMPCVTSRLLASLQYLDLSDNLLTDLTLQESLCHGHSSLHHLRALNVSGNALKSLSTLSRMAGGLPRLAQLDVSRNSFISMPRSCSWPPSLTHLNLSWAKLTAVTPCMPPTLEVLDLSHNDLQDFPVTLPVLTELYLSGNKFLRLPPGWRFANLHTLTIQANTLNMFSRSDLQAYRRLRSLRAGGNKFVCSCEFVHFLQGARRQGAPFPIAADDDDEDDEDGQDGYVCDSPLRLQGVPVGRVRFTTADCHRVALVSACCGVALAGVAALAVALWRLHALWYLKMSWAWLRAKRAAARRRRGRGRRQGDGVGGEAEPLLRYDAFVSYSERDAAWVEQFLVPELEGEGEIPREEGSAPRTRPLSLCLHKRDFLPGQWIVDNIMAAMERSRATVFLLSRHFLQSDWCRYELDFSHFRLFEGEGGAAAILVLLEPLSRDDVPRRLCRLRRLMGSNTYLEWPQEEGQRAAFWRSLRIALGGAAEEEVR